MGLYSMLAKQRYRFDYLEREREKDETTVEE